MTKKTAKTSPKKKLATKPKAKSRKKKPLAAKLTWNPDAKLSLSEELFCRYYVLNEETRRNGTRSYDAAYDKKLDEQPTDDAVYQLIPSDIEGEPPQKKMVQASSYTRCENVCAQGARQLLRKPQISKRITQLLNEMLTTEFVDGELAKVIAQDAELKPKVSAIAEYNKVAGRSTASEVKHTHVFEQYDNMTDEELERHLAQGEKFFKKL